MKTFTLCLFGLLCACSANNGSDTAPLKPESTKTGEVPKPRPTATPTPRPTIPTVSPTAVEGEWLTLKSWGVKLRTSQKFLEKLQKKPKPHVSAPEKPGLVPLEQYYFYWDYNRQHTITIELRKVTGPKPRLFAELDQKSFARNKGYGGSKGALKYKVGYKQIRGPGHCSRGRCRHRLIDQLNGVAMLPLDANSYVLCHVYVAREDNPKALDFMSLFNICLSLRRVP
ncbi:hypothetical protein KKF84_00375 [Myxococcota bacterium]|nr:hypothetical protein [Myxococcota bacterium]MBU1533739.1 hypothetical protein [Myxococcota bacterium]